jgi:hypothetical protein
VRGQTGRAKSREKREQLESKKKQKTKAKRREKRKETHKNFSKIQILLFLHFSQKKFIIEKEE